MAAKTQPIIVIKKISGHGGHHGGAWKVAYADFVTAMMSLFIVLWLMGSSEKVKKAVAGYFNDPKGTANLLGTTMTGTGQTVSQVNTDELEKLKEKLEQEIKARKELEKLSKQIEITITPEGLRIELIEGKDGTFYEIGSAKLSASGQELLALLAAELKTLPNSLLIEGHTDATPYSSDAGYSNWDLSADRANSARRLHAAGRRPRRPGNPGARLRRPDAARKKQPYRSLQPQNLDSGEERQRGCADLIRGQSGEWNYAVAWNREITALRCRREPLRRIRHRLPDPRLSQWLKLRLNHRLSLRRELRRPSPA